MRAVIIAVVLVWAFAAEVAGGEITIGRWCDRMIPNIPKYDSILAIFITSDGKVILKAEYGDGSSGMYEPCLEAREKAAPKPKAAKPKRRKRGRPRKGEARAKEPIRFTHTPTRGRLCTQNGERKHPTCSLCV